MVAISSFPYFDDFSTDPVDRIYFDPTADCEVVWAYGQGWSGKNALRIRPPAALGQQSYAGLNWHSIPSTKRLNTRRLIRQTAVAAEHMQSAKWDIVLKFDTQGNERGSCERGMAMDHRDPLDATKKTMFSSQGVCSAASILPNLGLFNMYSYPEQWLCFEYEYDLNTGYYRVFVTTEDGQFYETMLSEINIATGAPGNPDNNPLLIEQVPSPYDWGFIDPAPYWGRTDENGTTPQPPGCYIYMSDFAVSNTRIGPPIGFADTRDTTVPRTTLAPNGEILTASLTIRTTDGECRATLDMPSTQRINPQCRFRIELERSADGITWIPHGSAIFRGTALANLAEPVSFGSYYRDVPSGWRVRGRIVNISALDQSVGCTLQKRQRATLARTIRVNV